MSQIAEATTAPEREPVSPDQEAWVQDRILAAMRMALSMHRERRVGADEPAFQAGLRGIAEGASIEVIRTLGMEPGFVNLRHPESEPLMGIGTAIRPLETDKGLGGG